METVDKGAAGASCYHNAGHAVATALIEFRQAAPTCGDPEHQARWQAEYEAMTALGSVVAERLFVGAVEPTGAGNDIANAFRHVAAMTPIPGEQAAYVAFLSVRVEYLLERHRDFIEHVASRLLESGGDANQIARADVCKFIRGG